jgi:hypothetical protein
LRDQLDVGHLQTIASETARQEDWPPFILRDSFADRVRIAEGEKPHLRSLVAATLSGADFGCISGVRLHARLSELCQEGGRARAVGQSSQRPQRILGAKSEHGTEGVGIDTNSTKLAQ